MSAQWGHSVFHGKCPSMKHTRAVTFSGPQGSTAQATVMARHLQQRREKNCSFIALLSIPQMATGDLETAAAAGAEQLESSESEGRSAELEVLICCEDWSTARRASSLVDKRREVVVI